MMKKICFLLAIFAFLFISCKKDTQFETGDNVFVVDCKYTVYIDLGLPSGLIWATCNVGASAPEESGDYFAWGELSSKSDYSGSNSVTYNKYIDDFSGNPIYDVARERCGGNWRMPNTAEVRELKDNCTWLWTNLNGVEGYEITGPNGKSIFIPDVGFRFNESSYTYVSAYWTSTPCGDNMNAYILEFDEDGRDVVSDIRYQGCCVRPVLEAAALCASEPVVVTNEVSDITVNSVICGGIVKSEGYLPVTARGVCWSTNQNPTISDPHTTDGSGIGLYKSSLTQLIPNVTYYVRAYATNKEGTSYGEQRSFIINEENGHIYVDLGLPGGTKWATCNIGADVPEGLGNYYAWGETATKGKYGTTNCITHNDVLIKDISGNTNYDAATYNWGAAWRMPTYSEMKELVTECEWLWITQNKVDGYKVIGPNGNCIFLPAAGFRSVDSYYTYENNYWTSTPDNTMSYCLIFDESDREVNTEDRFRGYVIRPVID